MNKTAQAILTQLIPISPVFSTQDAARAANVHADVATRDLGQLAARGILTRVARGVWADTRHPDFSPYVVVPYLLRVRGRESVGYVSLLSALNLHGFIQQIPRAIQVVIPRQRTTLRTPVGTYEFHQMESRLLGSFEPFGNLGRFNLATPGKALFDTLYLSVRRGNRFAHLPEVEIPRGFRQTELLHWIARTPDPRIRSAVAARWIALKQRIGSPAAGTAA